VKRGLVNRNVALVAHAPKLRTIPKVEPQAWNAQQLQAFLQAAAGHRLFAAFWLLAATGMRRSELLGLRWDDVDFKKAQVSVNRGLVAVAYEVRESRGKTANSRRAIDLAATTINVLKAWRVWQRAEQKAAGVESAAGYSPAPRANPSTPTRSPRPSNGSPTEPECHGYGSTTSATPTAPC
jgi:integrase